jgi:uncharacterized protein YcaQ
LEHLSISEARRIALAAQGLNEPRPARVTVARVARTIRQLGLIQLDFVNVLVPAHYLVLFSRLGPFDRSLVDRVVYSRGEFTEQWAHEASIIPVEHWPLLRHRMEVHRARPWGFDKFMESQSGYVQAVLEQVRKRGALTAADLPDTDGIPRRIADLWAGADAWVGTIPRATLEALFGQGTLAIAERLDNFARRYDLAERVIPAEHFSRSVDAVEAQRELIRTAARCYGIATADDLADYYRMPARTAQERIVELAGGGELVPVRVEGWRAPAYLHKDAKVPRKVDACALLSPFDPVVWYRQRAERLFGFEYRIEIYTPKEKRRWGYYVLPFVLGERIVARVDLKAERAEGRLSVLAIHYEEHAKKRKVMPALIGELRNLMKWLGLRMLDPIPAAATGSASQTSKG